MNKGKLLRMGRAVRTMNKYLGLRPEKMGPIPPLRIGTYRV